MHNSKGKEELCQVESIQGLGYTANGAKCRQLWDEKWIEKGQKRWAGVVNLRGQSHLRTRRPEE